MYARCLVLDFALLSLSFSYILQDFLFWFWIWLLAEENLGSSHHMSVVRDRWLPLCRLNKSKQILTRHISKNDTTYLKNEKTPTQFSSPQPKAFNWTKLLLINWTHCQKIRKLYKQYYHILECILGLYRVHLPVVLVELLHNRHLASKMLPLGYQTKNL